eukprot:gnl/Spiro4/15357_TR8258_c0_g1_i1.p1 gnl/Spiro4/15357_TR8258_c0_g1~~gnl/Spiro4/15357_TR8258_c0_g1_i1.p1  ORF type:complete len:234 (-),score=41.58 gnl/Spiro4/15357_TR8258_c0_g1_i1:245-946(-)
MTTRVGIDFGGVVIGRDDRFMRSSDPTEYCSVPPNDGAFHCIRELVLDYGARNIFIISKAGESTIRKTNAWLAHHDFFSVTGMLRENVLFCSARSGKVPLAIDNAITHFIDDHAQVLAFVGVSVPVCCLLAITDQGCDAEELSHLQPEHRAVKSWSEFLEVVRTTRGSTPKLALGSRPPPVPCAYFLRGRCRLGTHCPDLHDSATPAPCCKYFARGNCRNGAACTIGAHSRPE